MKTYRPRFVLLENVDRLLKSPAAQKGRDFAIMLRSMGELGYQVQWRVVNSADYGLPQKRRRVFIVGERVAEPSLDPARLIHDGVLARALPIKPTEAKFFGSEFSNLELDDSLYVLSSDFGTRSKSSPFENAGIMDNYKIYTKNVIPDYPGPWAKLGDVLQPEGTVDESFYIPEEQLEQWKRLKYKKDKERRIHRATGTPYTYSEGSIPFPDSIEGPSRTILTGEGGTSPSRFKHVVEASDGRYRRLTPEELETLNGFSKGWTEGVSPGQRAFLMGNALVVDIVKKIGKELKAAMETRP
jgi:DNA (cytosine-5)-methyltransferase 1